MKEQTYKEKARRGDCEPEEAAFWDFDAMRSGYAPYSITPRSEREAFKASFRKFVRGLGPPDVPDEQPESCVKDSLQVDDPRDPGFWKDAPEEAQRFALDCTNPWLKADDGDIYHSMGDGEWIRYDDQKNAVRHWVDAIPRPEPEPAWDGEGLPPEGTVCAKKGSQYAIITVLAHDHGHAVYRWEIGSSWSYGASSNPDDFVPIRSHRDRVIDEALERVETADMTETEVSWVRDLLYDLYMDGWLRPPESDDTETEQQQRRG